MTEQQQTVMRRKTQAGRALHQSRTVSLLKAVRLTLSKVGNDLFSLPVATLGATQDIVAAENCADIFHDDHLLILLDGPEGARGAVMVDPVLVGGLIQQQTMGAVFAPQGQGPARSMTATDASLVAPLINAVLTRAAALPETDAERDVLAGFQFGAKAQDVRLLMLALDAREFHVLRFTLDLAKGVRQGEMVFCLPVSAPPPPPVDDPVEDWDTVPPDASGKTLCASVLALKADLMVSLTQVQLPIHAAGALRVGQLLELGHVSFEQAQIRTRQGRVLAHGVLGQQNGTRAIRLTHRAKRREGPQRRATDLEAVTAEQAQDAQFEDFYSVQDLPALPDRAEDRGADAEPETQEPAMPDLSDLPGFEEEEVQDPAL